MRLGNRIYRVWEELELPNIFFIFIRDDVFI